MATTTRCGFDQRLRELGIALPPPTVPAFSYVPTLRSQHLLFISGQLGLRDGALAHRGRLGAGVAVEEARDAARLCGLNVLAQVWQACGGTLDRVRACLRMTGYVASAPDFFEQARVMDGCSELMQAVFGEAGRHTRTTVGISALPFNAVIEVDAIFEVDADAPPSLPHSNPS